MSDWRFVFLFIWGKNLKVGGCGGLTAGGWTLRQGAGWAAQNGARVWEKEDISLELVTAGRGRAAFQLAWRLYQGMCVTGGLGGAVHGATPSASTAHRQSDPVICQPIHMAGAFIFFPHCWWPHLFFLYLCVSLWVWSHQGTENRSWETQFFIFGFVYSDTTIVKKFSLHEIFKKMF